MYVRPHRFMQNVEILNTKSTSETSSKRGAEILVQQQPQTFNSSALVPVLAFSFQVY